ncbi:hypothetical protein [Thaumasiovibrio subtropicus]|uniref:hypothetical protein n=1 Tax=Thaumasiovibrio subtropicus TaxID=1891207 RepID=UPI000B359DD7|nr:hypothetical protein [Thaumasiovibrio subtropicus]
MSEFYNFLANIYAQNKAFYTVINGEIKEAKLAYLSDDYAIVRTKLNEETLDLNVHVSQVVVLSKNE